MAKIVVVDEETADANQTILASVTTGVFDQGDLFLIQPPADLSDMVDQILETGCSALLTDFKLREAMPAVTYNGIDLVAAIRKRRTGFPCFLTTSYAPEALQDRIDPNRVYAKANVWSQKQEGEVHFFDRVSADVREWETDTAEASTEHAALRNKAQTEDLTAAELIRLIELDTFIENRFEATHSLDAPLKKETLTNFGKISSKAEQLIADLTRALDDVAGAAEPGQAETSKSEG